MIEYLLALKDINITFSVGGIVNFINNMSFPVATVVIALLVLLAVQGYKIFKSLTYVIASVGLGFAGHLYLAPRINDFIEPRLPASLSVDTVDVAIALVCALIGVLIAHFAYQFFVFCIGGVAGYLVGYFFVAGILENYFQNLPFLSSKIAYIAVGCVCGLIVAVLFLLVFKHLYIIVSSIGFMALASYILFRQLLPGQSLTVAFAFVAVGSVIGVFMMVHQFDEEEKSKEFKF